jgi:FeS assembly SUF system protein
MVMNDVEDDSALGKLEVLGGVREFPARVKCATLAWDTLQIALKECGKSVPDEDTYTASDAHNQPVSIPNGELKMHPTMTTEAVDPSLSEEDIRANVIAALRTIYDPEIHVNILDLGLIYLLDIDPQGNVEIEMTLTAPACPVAGTFPGIVEAAVSEVPGVNSAHVELVWEPPWSIDSMTDEVKLELGLL